MIENKKDIMDRMITKLNSIRPRKKEAGFFEVSRSNKNVMSKIRYVLDIGIDSFDSVTGGIPFGRITEIYGLDACGKTALAIRAAVRAQKRAIHEKLEDGTTRPIDKKSKVIVLYIDNEQSLDDGEKLVVDGEELDCIISRCDTIDQMFKMIDAAINEIAKEENEENKPFLVVIVDTIASTSSREEMTREWGKEDYARQPKQLREGFRTLMRNISRHNVCVICTNQVSDNFKAAKGGYNKSKGGYNKSNLPQDTDFTAFGGKALRYYARLRIFMYLVREKYKLRKGALTSSGFVSGFYTRKNAQNWPSRDGRMVLIYGKGWDDQYSLLEQLIFYKFAETTEDGEIEFFFKKNGIPTTTFGEKSTSLEEDDENEGKKKKKESNPFIENRGQWPIFYEEHKVDFDAMRAKMSALLFTDEAEERVSIVQDDDDDAVDTDTEDVLKE